MAQSKNKNKKDAKKSKEEYDVADVIVLEDKKKKDEFDLGKNEVEADFDEDDMDFEADFDDGGD